MAMILSKLWPESWEQTDGQTDGQTVAIIIPPPNFVCGGGKNIDTDPSFPGFCLETLEIMLSFNKALGDIPIHIKLCMPNK